MIEVTVIFRSLFPSGDAALAWVRPPQEVVGEILNRMLARQPNLLTKLSVHSGRTVRVRAVPADAAFTIDFDGSLRAADPVVQPDVVLTIDTAKLLAQGWRLGQAVTEQAGVVHISGDVAVAQTLSTISRAWRFDAEDWLAQYVGDVAAVQLVNGAKQFSAMTAQLASRTGENVAEYLSHETPVLTARTALLGQSELIAQLARRLAALDAQAQGLEARLPRVDPRVDDETGAR